jgi:hypothetical protein
MTLKNKKIEITFRREKGGMLTSWELSSLLNNVSSNYYKNELLRLVLNKVGNGTDAKDVVILDNSFQFDKSYNKLQEINLGNPDSLKWMYQIGKPISMLPNQDVFRIYLLFDTFARINQLFYGKQIRRLDRKTLFGFVDTNKNFDECLDNINEYALDQVEYYEKQSEIEELNKKKEEKDIFSTKKKIGEIVESAKKEDEAYRKDEELMKKFIDEAEKDKSDLENDEYSRIKAAYFVPFFDRFTTLSRPLIGIYSKQKQKISILGINHINRDKRDEEFFDIKSISHESPVKITLAVGRGYSNLLQYSLEMEEEQILSKRPIQKLNQADRQKYDRLMDLDNQIQNLPGNGIFTLENQLANIRNKFVREEFEIFHKACKEKNHDAFSKYNFLFESLSLAGPRDAGDGGREIIPCPPIFREVPKRDCGVGVRNSGDGGNEIGVRGPGGGGNE